MKAECKLMLSKNVYTILMGSQEIYQSDKITLEYQDELAFRNASQHEATIRQFLLRTSNYRQAIEDPQKRNGRVMLEYTGFDDRKHLLSPLYHEDLALLGISRGEEDNFLQDFIASTKRKVASSLNKQDSFALVAFFQNISYLFGSAYNIKNGYYDWISDLQNSKNTQVARKKLLQVFRKEMTPPKDGREEGRFYFRARAVYDYVKENGLLETKAKKGKVVKALSVSQAFPPNETPMLNQTEKQGVMMPYTSAEETSYFPLSPQDAFLEKAVQKYKGKGRQRMADLHMEYMASFGRR